MNNAQADAKIASRKNILGGVSSWDTSVESPKLFNKTNDSINWTEQKPGIYYFKQKKLQMQLKSIRLKQCFILQLLNVRYKTIIIIIIIIK